MKKELPKENWVDFLMNFAKNNEGKMVRVYAKGMGGGTAELGQNKLISFEGDCSGEIVNGVRLVIGNGPQAGSLFHYISAPTHISYEASEEKGTINKLTMSDVQFLQVRPA